MKKTKSSHPMAEKLLEETLLMIDRNNGIQGMNLRTISRLSGCAHTNIYNYFESIEDLEWTALDRILDKWHDFITGSTDAGTLENIDFITHIGDQMDFAIEHPGWYRLIWFDQIAGSFKPPQRIVKRYLSSRDNFRKLIISASDNKLNKKSAMQAEDIIHGYIHGDVCLMMNNRTLIHNRNTYKLKIIQNCKLLVDLLCKKTK